MDVQIISILISYTNNLHLTTKTLPVTVGADATVYVLSLDQINVESATHFSGSTWWLMTGVELWAGVLLPSTLRCFWYSYIINITQCGNPKLPGSGRSNSCSNPFILPNIVNNVKIPGTAYGTLGTKRVYKKIVCTLYTSMNHLELNYIKKQCQNNKTL